MLLWFSLHTCLLILVLVQSHQAEIIIVKRLIQERNVIRGLVEARAWDTSYRLYPLGHAADFSMHIHGNGQVAPQTTNFYGISKNQSFTLVNFGWYLNSVNSRKDFRTNILPLRAALIIANG